MAVILLFFAMVEAGLAVDSYAPRHGHGPSSAGTSLLVFLQNRTTSRASHRSRRSARNSSPCGGARHARPATAPLRRPTLQSTHLEGGEAKWSFGLWVARQPSLDKPSARNDFHRKRISCASELEFLMQPIKSTTMVLEPGEVNDNKILVEPLHCPFVEHLAPMRGVSADGQICAAEGAEDAQIEDLPQVSVQSIGQVDPKTPRWTQRVLSGPAIGYAGHREVFFITP